MKKTIQLDPEDIDLLDWDQKKEIFYDVATSGEMDYELLDLCIDAINRQLEVMPEDEVKEDGNFINIYSLLSPYFNNNIDIQYETFCKAIKPLFKK